VPVEFLSDEQAAAYGQFMVNDERDLQGDGRDSDGRPEPPRWIVFLIAAALVAGGLIESTRRAVRSAVSTVRRWLHLT